MDKDCPTNVCSCKMNNIVWNTEQTYLIPVITVNCSNQRLKEMPSVLPVNTTTLLLQRNNISNLLPLTHNKVYANIADIYLDENQVTSIDNLEGAQWLKMFRVLSLRGNKLKEVEMKFIIVLNYIIKTILTIYDYFQLPVYVLDNAFEENKNVAKVYLGNNPWKCDCSFTPDFQNLLIKYSSLVKDKNDVTCFEQEDDENSNEKVNLKLVFCFIVHVSFIENVIFFFFRLLHYQPTLFAENLKMASMVLMF